MPDQTQVKDFYDSEYYATLPDILEASSHHKKLATKLGIKNGMNVLDVACGTGAWLKAVSELGANIAGIDLSEKAIQFCQKHLPEGDFYCQPATPLPFPDNQFDVVTCLGSLEHFPNQLSAVKEISRVLKPTGKAIILVPNSEFLGLKLGLFKGTDQTKAIEKPATLQEWEKLFSEGGISHVSSWKDTHILSRQWILQRGRLNAISRAAISLAAYSLPLRMQYQVYFECTKYNAIATT